MANTHCVHACHNMYVCWVATPLACVYISYICFVLFSAAGIKKYIVGLVIKLSSDPESAEVNLSIIFDSAMQKFGSSNYRHLLLNYGK